MNCRKKWERIAAETVGEDLGSGDATLIELVETAVAEFYKGSASLGLRTADFPVRSSYRR